MTKVVAVLAILVVIGALASAWTLAGATSEARTFDGLEGDPTRGAYLARLYGCVSCHTDIAGGGPFLGGGPGITTGYGTFHAPNITSDVNFGIGAWTLEQFSQALVAGRAPDGRDYYPVFPYTAYSTLANQDIIDLWAALRTVTPAQTRTPAHELSFATLSRSFLGAWKRLAALRDTVVRDDARSAEWNRGAYIATGPGLCAMCHSPRSLLGDMAGGRPLAGSDDARRSWMAGPLTSGTLKSNGWTTETLAEALVTGRAADGRAFTSPMSEVVRTSTAHLNEADLAALVEFLMADK